MNKSSSKQKNEQGIILLEAIIAVGVLITIFTASIALYIGAVGGLRITNDQLIATYLAQDGMEQVIAKRQFNYENDLAWLNGINCPSSNPCSVDYFNNPQLDDPMQACGSNCKLYTDTAGTYSHNTGGNESYFSRSVKVEIVEPNVEAQTIVTVSWSDGTDTFTLPITYNLYNNPNNNM